MEMCLCCLSVKKTKTKNTFKGDLQGKAGVPIMDGNVLAANHPGPLLHVTPHHLFSFLCHSLARLSNKVNNNASKFIEIWKLNNNVEKLRHWTRMTEDYPQSVLRTVRWWKNLLVHINTEEVVHLSS